MADRLFILCEKIQLGNLSLSNAAKNQKFMEKLDQY